MPFNEADTRAKLIDPGLHARGWTEDLICREETAGAVEIVDGRPRRRARGRVDYTLRVKIDGTSQAVAVALLEGKAEHLPPTHGLEQAKVYGACRRLNVHKRQLSAATRAQSETAAMARAIDGLSSALLSRAFVDV